MIKSHDNEFIQGENEIILNKNANDIILRFNFMGIYYKKIQKNHDKNI